MTGKCDPVKKRDAHHREPNIARQVRDMKTRLEKGDVQGAIEAAPDLHDADPVTRQAAVNKWKQ